jgi:outer membrane protein assembly factor BamB
MNCQKIFPALLLVAFAVSSHADWARWRGPNANGTWPEAPSIALQGSLEFDWRQRIGGGYSGITVADGRAYTMDREGETPNVKERILCFDAATGEPEFAVSYAADYAGLQYGSGPRASVTIHQGKAYALGANGNIHCIDAETGEVIWSMDSVATMQAERPTWGFAAAPVIWKNTVIYHIGVPGGSYVAFDKTTGKEIWRGPDDPAGYATPVFTHHDSRDLMIGWTPKHIVAIDPDSGEVIWKSPYEVTSGVSIATPLIHDGIVLAAGYWQGSKAIRIADGSLAWENNEYLRGLMSQGFARDGVAWILDKEHGLNCFDLQSGEKFWDDGHQLTPADRNPQATFIRLRESDTFLVLNSNGELIHAAIDRNGVTEHWREQLIGKTWAHPAYHGDRVFARDDRSIVSARLPIKQQ